MKTARRLKASCVMAMRPGSVTAQSFEVPYSPSLASILGFTALTCSLRALVSVGFSSVYKARMELNWASQASINFRRSSLGSARVASWPWIPPPKSSMEANAMKPRRSLDTPSCSRYSWLR